METAVEQFTLALIKAKAIKPSATKDFVKANTEALKIEIKQAHEYAEFAIRCDRKDMKILNFDGYIKLNSEQCK